VTARILPRTEYARLADTYLSALRDVIPDEARVVVVEDDDGRIVASWMAFRVVHLEGCSVAEDQRGNPAVLRRLLGMMHRALGELGAVRVMTAADSDHVASLLFKLGAVPLPVEHFVLEVTALDRWAPHPSETHDGGA